MSSVAQFKPDPVRRHTDPPALWHGVLIGSLLLHLLALMTVRWLHIDLQVEPPPELLPVEIIDVSPNQGTNPTTPTTTLTAPRPATESPAVENPANSPTVDQPIVTTPSEIDPSPSPKAALPSPKPMPSPTSTPSPIPAATAPPIRPPKATPPAPQPTATKSTEPIPPNDPFSRVVVSPAPVPGNPGNPGSPGNPVNPGSESLPGGSPANSGTPISPVKAAIGVGIDQQQLTELSQREVGGKATLTIEVPPQLEVKFFGGLTPGTQLVAQVQFAVDHQTEQVVSETINISQTSPAVTEGKISLDDLKSLVKRSLENARFKVTIDSPAVQKAKFSEWTATMRISVL
jgi:outer membrane biosynthesis protein TonB